MTTVEQKIKAIIEEMGLSYIFASWRIANVKIDELIRTSEVRYPLCINIMPFDGQIVCKNGMMKDAPNCVLAFCDEIPLDFDPEAEQPKVEALKRTAKAFIARVNADGYFTPVSGAVNYNLTYDRFDANLVIVTISLRLEEAPGECEESYITPC